VVEVDRNSDGVCDPDEDTNGNGVFDPPYRDLTLAGPDFNRSWMRDLNGDGNREEGLATLLRGVVGVYTATVELP
jgi:hypothetical protein